MDFEERCVVIEKDGAFECYILSVPDTVVGFHKRVRMPAGSDFEPDEESWSVTDQIPYAEKDYLDVGSPESIGRVLRVTHSDASACDASSPRRSDQRIGWSSSSSSPSRSTKSARRALSPS